MKNPPPSPVLPKSGQLGRPALERHVVATLTGRVIAFRSVAMLLLVQAMWGQSEAWTSHDPVHDYIAALTNYPTIQNLVLEFKTTNASPRFFQFRYQSNAFFFRELIESTGEFGWHSTRLAAGRWEDEYWHYKKDAGSRVFARYIYDPSATNSESLFLVRSFSHIFSLFGNAGISTDGINSLRVEDDHLVSRALDQGYSTRVHLAQLRSNTNAPTEIRAIFNPDPTTAVWRLLRYRYDRTRAPIPYPAEITCLEGSAGSETFSFQLIVHEMSLGDRRRPLPRDLFVPALSDFGTGVTQTVHTNGRNFEVTSRGLEDMGLTAQQGLDLLEKRGVLPRRYIWALLVLGVLCFPVWMLFNLARQRASK
jgi:hypothetical protein